MPYQLAPQKCSKRTAHTITDPHSSNHSTQILFGKGSAIHQAQLAGCIGSSAIHRYAELEEEQHWSIFVGRVTIWPVALYGPPTGQYSVTLCTVLWYTPIFLNTTENRKVVCMVENRPVSYSATENKESLLASLLLHMCGKWHYSLNYLHGVASYSKLGGRFVQWFQI